MQSFADTATGSFLAPDHEYPSHLTLTLTATDANGVSASTSIELSPKTVELTFMSDPASLQLGVFGKTGATPFTRTLIVSSATSVSAPGPQTVDGVNYEFAGWSDGSAATHTLIAPDVPTTYTAMFTPGRPWLVAVGVRPERVRPACVAAEHVGTGRDARLCQPPDGR